MTFLKQWTKQINHLQPKTHFKIVQVSIEAFIDEIKPILGEEHEFYYVDTSQKVALLALPDCQESNARIKEKKILNQPHFQSLIFSIETMMEDFKPRITEKHEFE